MRNALVVLTLALLLVPLQTAAAPAGSLADTASGEAGPLGTPLVAPTPDQPRHLLHRKAAHLRIQHNVMPVFEVQAALRAYIAKTEGDDKGLTLLGPPKMGKCGSDEVCEDIWYVQKFIGPHGEIGGEAIITSSIKRPSIYSVVTLAAGAADSVDGFAAFDVPASAARGLLRPAEKIVPKKRKKQKILHQPLQRKLHGLGAHTPKTTATPI